MDTGIQLGRRFRSLKLWMILRHFGAERIRNALREHIRLAQLFASGWMPTATSSGSRRCRSASSASAPARAARHRGGDSTSFNERLLDAVNASGEVFLSHTRLDGRFVLRLAIGHLRTTEHHVARAWKLLREHTAQLATSSHS